MAVSVTVKTTAASIGFIAAVYEKQIPYGNDNQKSKGKSKSKNFERGGRKDYAKGAKKSRLNPLRPGLVYPSEET
jgi:hypothetical protein